MSRAKDSRKPTKNRRFQGIASTDTGVVHRIQFDGVALVHFAAIAELFRANMADLEWKDLPPVRRAVFRALGATFLIASCAPSRIPACSENDF